MYLIEASHLSKKYNGVTALNSLSLTMQPGEVLGLLGPNGAGKTTAIHIFLGLLSPSSGSVSVLGLSPLKNRHALSKRINFSSAYVQLPGNLKVIENMKVFAGLYGIAHARRKIDELFELFNMKNLATRLAGSLSSGEKTRLNICKSLLNDPELLLLDEPTASLDPEMASTVRSVLQSIQQKCKMGVVYTSHNMEEVERMCDRVLFINHGRIMAEGSQANLLEKYACNSLEEVFIKLVRS